MIRAARGAERPGGFPAGPVRIVVAFPPGGLADGLAQAVRPRLQAILGVPVAIDHRPGLSGTAGLAEMAREAPDGRTWCLATASLSIGDTLLAPPYRSVELTACCLLGTVPLILAAHPSLGLRTLAEVVARGQARPGELSYASSGDSSATHVAMELLQRQGDFRLDHAPYRGGGPALQDALAGYVPLIMSHLVVVLPHLRSGGLRPLGIASLRESPALPGVPTFAAQGFPAFEAQDYGVLVGPAAVPEATTLRMQAALADALQDPGVRTRLRLLGVDIVGADPGRTAAFLAAESARWGTLVREAGIASAG